MLLNAQGENLYFRPGEKQIYVMRKKGHNQILSHDGRNILYRCEYDMSDIAKQNSARKALIGAGWSQSRDLKEEFEIPADVYYSHPDCIEYQRTRNRAVMRRFLAKYPQYRTTTGNY